MGIMITYDYIAPYRTNHATTWRHWFRALSECSCCSSLLQRPPVAPKGVPNKAQRENPCSRGVCFLVENIFLSRPFGEEQLSEELRTTSMGVLAAWGEINHLVLVGEIVLCALLLMKCFFFCSIDTMPGYNMM